MEIMYGNVGMWEHYWVRYKFRGEEYFIDLTMQQFDSTAPKLAISKATNRRASGEYSHIGDDGELMLDYLERQRAFQFYTDPVSLKKPEIDFAYSELIANFRS